ncbi:LysE family transporter [[Pseudomonas] boreopolis]|uniref:LysE family transporter n=1 Tax=Xanthomonas boreopolis TaxID=86183 RepID=UPI003D4F167C
MPWMGIQNPWAFAAAVLVFLALPGPGTFTLLTATGRSGIRAGYTTLAGLLLGDQVLMWLAVAGVAALLKANPLLFHGVQYLGMAYLIWIGLQLLCTPKPGAPAGLVALKPGHYFRQGLLVTLLNPKAIVFYMAFFPLFIDPATHRGLPTFATMAALIALLGVAWCSLLILLGHALARRLSRHPRTGAWLRRGAGVFLVGFGVRLGMNG